MGTSEIIIVFTLSLCATLAFIIAINPIPVKPDRYVKKEYINLLDCLIDKQETVRGMMHQVKELDRFRNQKHTPDNLKYLINQKIEINTELIRKIYENTN